MNKLFSIRSEIIPIDRNFISISKPLVHSLTQFTEQHYLIENAKLFVDQVVKPQQSGEIIVFYGEANELVGYTRLYQQQLNINGKCTTIYSGNTYNNQTHNVSSAAARLALTQTMKYQLTHPNEELIHFSYASTPRKYQFLARLSNTIYPNPDSDVPQYILELVKGLKENNNWTSCLTHPMLISGQPSPRRQPIPEPLTGDKLSKYYLSLNPKDAIGCTLLVSLPLNLGNIGYSIRQLLTQTQEHH